MTYRAEIDGLRAIAVIPVILFHAGYKLFNGGFVGVDVFFVVSGYLITTVLIEDLENKRFNLVKFYERRARRILPALFFVMLVSIPFAWMWMFASQMKDFSQSLVAVSMFASNILFWKESGYFAAASEAKPFLHTWSLAVEEQYYVLFPIFLFLIWRFGKNRVFWIIVLFAVISLALSEWGWRHQPMANFYLAPARAWELLAGSIAAFIVHKRGVRRNELLSILGLTVVLFSIFAFNDTTPFPSVYALIPVVGVVLLILYAAEGTIIAKLLSTKGLVGIGLISYSAYLWHQPLFAFARIISLESPSVSLMILLAVSSIALAYFSWRFIEKPFRNKDYISSRVIFSVSLLGILFFSSLGLVGHRSDGFAQENEISVEEPTRHSPIHNKIKVEAILNSTIYVVGDSHAEAILAGLEEVNLGEVIGLTSSGCIPFRNVDRYDARHIIGDCARTTNGYLDQLRKLDNESIVILSSMGPVNLDGTTFMGKDPDLVKGLGVDLITDLSIDDHYKVFELGMRETLRELESNTNLLVIFVIDVPELGIDRGCIEDGKVITLFDRQITDLVASIKVPISSCSIPRSAYDTRSRAYKDLVYRVLRDFPNVLLFDPTEYFCNAERCHGYHEEFGYLYSDSHHIGYGGSMLFAQSLARELSEDIKR